MPRTKTTPGAIALTAARVFRERGYHATSMSDLAAATGLTKGAFYHHFPDKAAVMAAALRAVTAAARERVFDRLLDADLLPEERLAIMQRGAERLFVDARGGCLIANTVLETRGVDDRFAPLLAEFVDAWREGLTAIARDAGHVTPAAAAEACVADVEGSVVLMRLYGDRAYLDRALARMRQTLVP